MSVDHIGGMMTTLKRTSVGGVLCADDVFVRNRRHWRASFWMPPRVTVDPENMDALPRVQRRAGRVVYVLPGGREVCE